MNDFGEKVRAAEREAKAKEKPSQNTKGASKRTTRVKTKAKTPSRKPRGEKQETPPKSLVGRNKDGTMKPGNPVPGAKVWKPGVSPNPGGRPKLKPFTDEMRLVADSMYTGKETRFKGMSIKRVLVLRQFELAIEKGDMRAVQEIQDRVEGRVPQSMEHAGPGGAAIPVEFSSAEENERKIMALMAKASARPSDDGGGVDDGNGDTPTD